MVYVYCAAQKKKFTFDRWIKIKEVIFKDTYISIFLGYFEFLFGDQ